jgi:hypothetical protein
MTSFYIFSVWGKLGGTIFFTEDCEINMSQAIAEIGHFQKCLGNRRISDITKSFVEIPGISGDAFTNIYYFLRNSKSLKKHNIV